MRKVTIVGGNLFALAAKHLNDATQWFRIAQLNGISDPFNIGAPAGENVFTKLTDDLNNPLLVDPGNLPLLTDSGIMADPVTLIIPDPDATLAGIGVPVQ